MTKEDDMLEELKKIRTLLEPKPAPAAPAPPKGLWNEFKDFLGKYKVLGLAIAFIMGVYLGGLVQALVKDLLLPVIGLAIPGLGTWQRGRYGCQARRWTLMEIPPLATQDRFLDSETSWWL